MGTSSHQGDATLSPGGTSLAHVVEQLIIAGHYSAGHGPQLGEPRPPFERCEISACVTWRRYLAQRMP